MVITENAWWVLMGVCAVAFLADAGLRLVGWPGLIAGVLVGAELTVVALLRR